MDINEIVWTYMGRVAAVISVLTFIIAVYGWARLRVYDRNRKKIIKKITDEHEKYTNGALILSLGGPSIETVVKNFIKNDGKLKGLIRDELILSVIRKENIGIKDMDGIIEEIRQARKRMVEAGVNKIHFFPSGACVGSAIVGAVFSNGCPLIYYHYQKQETTYESFGPIERN